MANNTVMVLGVGNTLLSDDGAGVHVLKNLADFGLPQGAELVEGGIAGMGMLYLIEEAESLVVVDSVDAGAEPGAIFQFSPDEILVIAEEHNLSLHQAGLIEVLKVGRALGKLPPKVTIFAIQPKSIDWGLDLTPEVKAKMPKLVQLVAEEVMVWLGGRQ